jgi:hypothetical protein
MQRSQISVRLAGVDAPECAHFGAQAQACGEEAKFVPTLQVPLIFKCFTNVLTQSIEHF